MSVDVGRNILHPKRECKLLHLPPRGEGDLLSHGVRSYPTEYHQQSCPRPQLGLNDDVKQHIYRLSDKAPIEHHVLMKR